MKIEILNKVKYSKHLLNVYYYVGSFCIKIIRPFIRVNGKQIIFVSFGGRKYDDSPKAIYEKMLADPEFKNFDFIWAFIKPEQHSIPQGKIVKTDTFKYYKTLLASKIWITNSAVQRGLYIPSNNSIYVNTWHGTPIKKMGLDIDNKRPSSRMKRNNLISDIFLSQCEYEANIFSRAYLIPKESIAVVGLPRNDELVHRNSKNEIASIKKKLNIPSKKKVILYAPTFREYNRDSGSNCTFTLPFNLQKWEKQLSNEFVLLIRAHYEIVRNIDFGNTDFVINVSSYESLNELMLISDLLISDYSSIFFDYSILERPMLAYCYDFDTYNKKRGMYFDIREMLECYIDNEDDIIDEIVSKRYINRINISKKFKDKFVERSGDSSERCIELIKRKLKV